MKKSYLALGLVAAVAMSSCSNDEPMPNGNGNQNPAQGYEPISLTLSNSVADVTVGTRGTGTVGSMDVNENNWNYEDIYVLMTSTQTRKEMGETEATWGFTSAGGDGPFLHEQFNGEFWARPYAKGNTWGLNYFIDHNEWWNNAPIDKYYPMNGESQFFAFYVDDACEEEGLYTDAPLYIPGENDENTQGYGDPHKRPAITKENDKMTVKFQIDGTQDLMLGKAEGNFSAKTAREGKVPSITMNHMLSRLTFNIKKDARPTVTSHEMVTVTGIDVKSQNAGTMIVAYKEAPQNNELVTFTEGTDTFSLKQYPASPVKENNKHVCLDVNNDEIEVLARVYTKIENQDPGTGETTVTYEEKAELESVPLYYYKVSGVKTFTYDDGRGRGPITPAVAIEKDAEDNITNNGNVDADSYAAAMVLVEAAKPEPPVASLMDGKAELVDFEPVVLKDFFATQNEGLVGEAMFVAPGVEKYEMTLHLSMLIREKGEEFDGVDEEYDSSELIETYELPLTLAMPEGKTFEAGMSYQVNITIYGLENVVLEIKPTKWENGGHFDVGGDKDGDGIYNEDAEHDDAEYDVNP